MRAGDRRDHFCQTDPAAASAVTRSDDRARSRSARAGDGEVSGAAGGDCSTCRPADRPGGLHLRPCRRGAEHYRRGTDCALCECAKFRAGSAARSRGPRGSREARGARDSRGDGPTRPDASVSVVVAAHTMDRWEDIVRGSRRARAPERGAAGDDPGRRPQRRAAGSRPGRLPGRAGAAQPADRGRLGRPQHGCGRGGGDNHRLPRRRRAARSRTGSSGLCGYDDPRVQAVGGVARPVWPVRRPAHLPPELDWLVGCTYLGQPTVRTDVRNLWGCNMSVRRRGVRPDRRLRRGGRPDRADPARQRGDRAVHPDRAADPGGPGGLRAVARWCTTGSPRPAAGGPTWSRARTPRGSRRPPFEGRRHR